MKSSLHKWKKITNRSDNVCVHPTLTKLVVDSTDMRKWMLRACDRADTLDWMPYKTIVSDSIRTYYVNTNENSMFFTHLLVLRAYSSNLFSIEEWSGDHMISNTQAVVEKNPKAKKPTEEEKLQIMAFLGIDEMK